MGKKEKLKGEDEMDLLGLVKLRMIKGVKLAIRDFTSSDPYVLIKMGKHQVVVKRGVELAVRDVASSDPFVVVKFGKHKLKTHVIKKNVNPVWNEELTLSVVDPTQPIKFEVYDKDTFSFDDPMGNAELDIQPLVEAAKQLPLAANANGTIIRKLVPERQNCLAEESPIYYYSDGKVVQDVVLRLRNVETGELELQLQWVNLPN